MMENKKDIEDSAYNLQELLEVVISLQGRQVFPNNKICEIVTDRKQNPENYIKVYNACDGKHSVSELAKIASVSQPTMTPILQNWKNLGIIFQVKKMVNKFYKKLYDIELPKSKHNVKKNDKKIYEGNIQNKSSKGIRQDG